MDASIGQEAISHCFENNGGYVACVILVDSMTCRGLACNCQAIHSFTVPDFRPNFHPKKALFATVNLPLSSGQKARANPHKQGISCMPPKNLWTLDRRSVLCGCRKQSSVRRNTTRQ
jgi:hypothetical protein